jgi:hypothetical protein
LRRLKRGPLPPDQALKYAHSVASALRELHRQRRAHGGIRVESIFLATSGMMLAAPEPANDLRPVDDIAAFGAVLFEMLTGHKPPEAGKFPVGSTGLQAAALQLAERCIGATEEAGPDIQKVSTEVRLLLILARQPRAEPEPLALPDPGVYRWRPTLRLPAHVVPNARAITCISPRRGPAWSGFWNGSAFLPAAVIAVITVLSTSMGCARP